jgi:membrane-bound lytic murein transglycosylase A
MLKVKVVGIPVLLIFLAVGCGGKAVQSIKKTLPEQQIASRIISKSSSLLELVPSGNIPSLADDLDVASLSLAIDRSLQYFSRFNDTDVYYMGARQFTVAEMEETLKAFRQIVIGDESDQTKQNKIRDTFDFYKSLGDDKKGRVIFTGYYEPILNGSLEKTTQYQYPLYRTPDETVVLNSGKFVGRMGQGEVLPHYKRAEIDSDKSLAGRNLEIIWAKCACPMANLSRSDTRSRTVILIAV